MARGKRIVCYAVNGSGLGHVTRLLAVARWLRRYATFVDGRAPEILFLTSSEATGVLAEAGFPSFKIPSKTVVRSSGFDPLEYRRLARHFVWHTLGVFAPDLLVVDTFPSGSFDELFQLLDGPFRKAFILRQVKPDYAARPIFAAALGMYDIAVAPHAPPAGSGQGETRIAAAAAGASVAGRLPLVHCGEVLQLDREESRHRDEVFAELGLAPQTRLVYLSAGGGGDHEAERVLAALIAALRDLPDLHLLVGAGPLYRGRRQGGPRLTWSTEPGLARSFSACHAAIAAGGYNTFHELLYLQVPAAFFSQEKVADDQARRIADAAAQGACLQLGDPFDPDGVRRVLAELLRPGRPESLARACATLLPDNGARRCARLLLEPLYGEAALEHAARLLAPRLVHSVERSCTPAGAAMLLGGFLPRLLPATQLGRLPGSRREAGAWAQLLAELSPAAAAEVGALLQRRAEEEGWPELEERLVRLLERCEAVGIEPERLLPLLDAGAKKHPLQQEADRRWLPWAAQLVAALLQLVELEVPGLSLDEILLLYRIFPRITDLGIAASLASFCALLTRRRELGENAAAIQRQLQALKLAHRQVLHGHLAPLLAGGRLRPEEGPP